MTLRLLATSTLAAVLLAACGDGGAAGSSVGVRG